jgi:hypothetical protein
MNLHAPPLSLGRGETYTHPQRAFRLRKSALLLVPKHFSNKIP